MCRLHDWHVARLRSLEDLPDVAARLAVHPTDVRAIAHQPTRRRKLAGEGHGWERVSRGKGGDLLSAIEHDRVGRGNQRVSLGTHELRECGVDLGGVAGIERNAAKSELGGT